MNKKNLKNKIILITGSNGHLGLTISKALNKSCKKLILIDKDKKNKNSFGHYFQCNFENSQDIKNLIEKIKKSYTKIDSIINNAAMVGDDYKNKEDFSEIEWKKCLNINLISVYQLSIGLKSCLKKTKDPSIINVSSIYSILGPDKKIYSGTTVFNPASYSASKGGLNSLTRWLAGSLDKKIRVNSISLGGVLRKQSKIFIKRYTEKTILKRMANNKDLLGPVLFFLSSYSNYITGQNLVVDGGYSII
tara:strand:- start:85 stop:828 length:744 start_codon:yes stop_codon:yes gene_type:complete